MWKKVVKSFVLLIVLSLAWPAAAADDPSLVGWWKLDEGGGTTALDSSSYGNNGTLMNDPIYVQGQIKGALQLNGTDQYVEVPHTPILTVDNEVTVMIWFNTERAIGGTGANWQGLMSKSNSPRSYSLYTHVGNNFHFVGGNGSVSSGTFQLNEWTHVAAQVANGAHQYYINGEDAGTGGSGSVLPGASDTSPVYLGRTGEGLADRAFLGMLDDARVYNRALSQEEIAVAMLGSTDATAEAPNPGDEAIDVPRDAGLSWTAGEFAAKHDVYVGTSWDDVNDAATGTLVSQGQQSTSFDTGILEFDQTYYWRVDEVNAAPDNTIFKGLVWSFTVEPTAIPVAGITATASTSNTGMGPERTIDGSGLNALDQHSTVPMDMWLASEANPWIQYEFDKVYKLHEMLVWNSNQLIEAFIGFGIKEVAIETSLDGETWTAVNGTAELAKAPGAEAYEASAPVALDGVMAKFVKLSVVSAHGVLGQTGLSEVRFLALPVAAREPSPSDGAITDNANVQLSWRSGREAASHEVYLGTSADTMILIDTASKPTTTADGLAYMTTYTWSVTEVNEAAAPTSHAGETWTFTTPDFAVVDDFETFTGETGGEIFMTWFDGFGGDSSLGGSTTGHIDAPFVETVIVYDGSQSMPVFIDNDGGFFDIDGKSSNPTFSEVVREFDSPLDLTASGITVLSIMFNGSADLTGQLYCKIGSTKITYDGDAADLGAATWKTWNIDLSTVGGNLKSVRELAIGVEGGAAGILYIDAIRLYPAAPDTDKLLAYYSFDEGTGTTVADASGKGQDGAFVGEPAWVPGKVGTALLFDGVDDYVEIPHHEGLTVDNEVTVALWINPEHHDFTNTGWGGIMAKGNPRTYNLYTTAAGTLHFSTAGVGSTSTDTITLNEWSHVAAMVSAGSHAYYINGAPSGGGGSGIDLPGTSNTAPVTIGYIGGTNQFYKGMIDEVYIYGRALSAAEVAELAGQ